MLQRILAGRDTQYTPTRTSQLHINLALDLSRLHSVKHCFDLNGIRLRMYVEKSSASFHGHSGRLIENIILRTIFSTVRCILVILQLYALFRASLIWRVTPTLFQNESTVMYYHRHMCAIRVHRKIVTSQIKSRSLRFFAAFPASLQNKSTVIRLVVDKVDKVPVA